MTTQSTLPLYREAIDWKAFAEKYPSPDVFEQTFFKWSPDRIHAWQNEPYYLGAFLIGAYQEILGDLHNLFGDTNAVHVSTDSRGEVVLDAVIKGDTVREVLDYVEFLESKYAERPAGAPAFQKVAETLDECPMCLHHGGGGLARSHDGE